MRDQDAEHRDAGAAASPDVEAGSADALYNLMDAMFPGREDPHDPTAPMNQTTELSYRLRIAYARAREVNELDLSRFGPEHSVLRRSILYATLTPCLQGLVPDEHLANVIQSLFYFAIDDAIDESMEHDLAGSTPRELLTLMLSRASKRPH